MIHKSSLTTKISKDVQYFKICLTKFSKRIMRKNSLRQILYTKASCPLKKLKGLNSNRIISNSGNEPEIAVWKKLQAVSVVHSIQPFGVPRTNCTNPSALNGGHSAQLQQLQRPRNCSSHSDRSIFSSAHISASARRSGYISRETRRTRNAPFVKLNKTTAFCFCR